MQTEHDPIAAAFRRTYQRILEETPTAEMTWPPVQVLGIASTGPRPRGWLIALVAFLVTSGLWIGWIVASGEPSGGRDDFPIQTESTAPPPDMSGAPFTTPADAAIAAAVAQFPHIQDPRVTRMIVIFADDASVDLRVQVQADDVCHWYGVAGHVRGGAIEWRGGPALPCSG